jgi:hypothetical protein
MEVNIPTRNDHPMRDFLRDIITQIGNATTYAQTMLADPTLSPDQYKKISIQCMANTVVNKKGAVPSTIKRLFVAWDTPMPSVSDTILLKYAGSLSNILQIMSRQRGGARTKGAPRREPHSILTHKKKMLRSSRPTGRVILPSANRTRQYITNVATLLNEVYNSIQITLPGSDLIYCEDYVYFLYNYFIYIGETPLDPNYLYALLTDMVFMSGNYTLDQFKAHYDSFTMTGSAVYTEEDVIPQINNNDSCYSLLSPFEAVAPGGGGGGGGTPCGGGGGGGSPGGGGGGTPGGGGGGTPGGGGGVEEQMGQGRHNTLRRRKYYRRNRRSMKRRN